MSYISHIYVIESLFAHDNKTGKTLYDDIIERYILFYKKNIRHFFFRAENKLSFEELLNYISANAHLTSGGILVHIEAHGSTDLEGLIIADEDILTWERLVNLLRPINISTNNNLYLTLASCFGRYLYKGVDPYEKSAYCGYISATKAVTEDEVLGNFHHLFEELISNGGNLIEAYLELEKNGGDFFYKDSKRVFDENIKDVRKMIETDKAILDEIKRDPILNDMYNKGETDDDELMAIMRLALSDIAKKQGDAFKFSS